MNSPSVVLDVTGVSAGYGDIQVIRDVSLAAYQGRVTAVFGANGAGKSTLLSAVAGLIPTRMGAVRLDGKDLTAMPTHARVAAGIGLVQEGKRVLHRRTVDENLQLGGYRLARSQRRSALELAYDRFPVLRDKRDLKAGALSGGQQQMVAIAQALMPGPRVLLLDEPSAGLAPIIVSDLLRSIEALKTEGMAIVLVEQLVGQAMTVADHVVALQQGQVVIDDPAGQVDHARLHSVYLGEPVPTRPGGRLSDDADNNVEEST